MPETPYAPTEPPFRRYANTHDSISCADLTTPEEEVHSCNALARALGTAPATAHNVAEWNSVIAVATDGTPITRDKLADVVRHFPTLAVGALGLSEPEDPGYHLLHQTTGEACNNIPLTKAEVNHLLDALSERAASASPGPLPTRPHHGAAEVVAGSCSTVEGPAARARPEGAADAQGEGGRVAAVTRDPGEEELFPAEHPFIRLEPAMLPDNTPHICATDGTPLFKGSVSHSLLHAYSHPSAPCCHTQPDHAPPGFVHNRGDSYVPFITTYNGVRQPVNFVQTILTPNLLASGYERTRTLSSPSPFMLLPSMCSELDPSTS
jgi:hypothetical protein